MTENSEMTKQWLKRVHFSSFCSKQTPPQFELHVNLSMEELQEPNTVAGGYDITEQTSWLSIHKERKRKTPMESQNPFTAINMHSSI